MWWYMFRPSNTALSHVRDANLSQWCCTSSMHWLPMWCQRGKSAEVSWWTRNVSAQCQTYVTIICTWEGEGDLAKGALGCWPVTQGRGGGQQAILFTPPLIPARICWNPGIPCSLKRKTTLQKTDQSYTKEITIKGISSYVQNYHIRNFQQMKLTMTNDSLFVIWVPCRFQQHGTWFKLKKITKKVLYNVL